MGIRVVVAGVTDQTSSKVDTVKAEAEVALLTKTVIEEVVQGGVTLSAGKSTRIVGQRPIGPIIITTVITTLIREIALQTRRVSFKISGHTGTLSITTQLVEQIGCAVSAG